MPNDPLAYRIGPPRGARHRELAARRTALCIALMASGAAGWAQVAPSPAASAATPGNDASTLDTVLVTARKREERGQDVPQSLNVFSGKALEATGVGSLDELQYRTPGLSLTKGGGADVLSIRGVSNNASSRAGGPSTAVHFDGVYLSRPALALQEFFDLNRVEVLKGPEGTLYGRNATAGVINYITRDPSSTERFDGFVGGGSHGLLRAQAAFNAISTDSGGLRISAASTKDNGYTKNLNPSGGRLDSRDFSALRLKGIYQFSPTVEGRLTVQFVDDTGTAGFGISEDPATKNFVTQLGGPQRQDPRHIRVDTPPQVSRHGVLTSGTITADLGSGLTLKSITGYVRYSGRTLSDNDGSGLFVENGQTADRSNFWSQEFQLSGGSSKSLSWTSGIYASREKTSGNSAIIDSSNPPVDLTPFPIFTQDFNATTKSFAVFGEATYAITEKLSLLGGARYTSERLEGASNGSIIDFNTFMLNPFLGGDTAKSSRVTPKILLQYTLSRDSMLYGSVTSGFKSGGVNLNPPITKYRPEKIIAYEAGTKNSMLAGALEFDAAAFYYDYTDLQLRTVVGNQAPISNASKATIEGLELTLIGRPARGLTLDLNGAYVKSELKTYLSPATGTDLSGMSLPLAPKFSATAGAQYAWSVGGGAVTTRIEVNHQGAVIFPALQNPTLERQGPVTLLNASARYTFPNSSTYIAFIGRNLTDRTYLSNRNYSAGFADLETYAPPRFLEFRVGATF